MGKSKSIINWINKFGNFKNSKFKLASSTEVKVHTD